jgi:hypothetical protein
MKNFSKVAQAFQPVRPTMAGGDAHLAGLFNVSALRMAVDDQQHG